MINAACCVLKLRFLFSTNRRRHLTSSHQITRSPSDRKIVACLVKAVYNLCASLICRSWLEYNKVWDITRSFGISRDIWQLGFYFLLLSYNFWLLTFDFWLLSFDIWYITFYILHLTFDFYLFTFDMCYVTFVILILTFDIWHLCFLIIYLSRLDHKSKNMISADCLLKPNHLIRLHRCLSDFVPQFYSGANLANPALLLDSLGTGLWTSLFDAQMVEFCLN